MFRARTGLGKSFTRAGSVPAGNLPVIVWQRPGRRVPCMQAGLPNGERAQMIRGMLGGMVLVVCGTLALADTAPAPGATAPATNDEAAVLAAMDRYLAAISARDLDTMASMQTPDGTNYRARALPGGGMEVLGRPNSYWVDPARKDGHAHRERYWSPTVLVRGSIAMVWAPYEFWICLLYTSDAADE